MATDIADLNDEELREKLIEYGVNVGPITSTTRLFYEKKLGKLIDSGGNPTTQPETEESEEEEEEEDEEVQFNYSKSKPPVQPKPQYTSTPLVETPNPYKPVETSKPYKPVVQPRTATPTMPARRNVPSGTEETVYKKTEVPRNTAQKSGGGGGIGMWLKLFFLLSVAFLVYLVVINMNPTAENKIPLTFDGDN
ncbi:uncharacterized protein LOC127880831 [Dreissena polymorpha]|uniref:LEM domain-containing protein n=1 Tax=Dreissena polymorpha TaxID=45954 RepID=A0A9D4GPA0_DREPO|nr:uncharacterized protein LOC127880831 [Dreissena polymorpha]XP_052284242.1 uncharacterized protein LOC127880831 [Dreissena polymorpha]KAH3820493.1 hypothetical protein DPMN_122239 [Dreissena polymorpha]